MKTKLTRAGLVALALAAQAAGAQTGGAAPSAAASAPAAEAAAPVAAHPGVDAIYAAISDGLGRGDPELSRRVYVDDAIYLASFPSGIDRGATFHQRMRESADRMKADGATIAISFRVATRQLVGDGLVIDTGYYKTDMTRPTGEPRTMTRYNKFLVVAAKQADGAWKITHDASGPATKEVWEATESSS